MSIRYIHLGETRRDLVMARNDAARQIGRRVLAGFDPWTRYVVAPDGSKCSVTVFQSDYSGVVWAVYIDSV